MIERLSSIIHGEKFREQMIRFLPMDVQERTLLNKNYLYLLLQEIGLILETLGLEWKEKNGDIYCTNFLRKLSVTHFPEVLIQMLKVRDKYGIVVAESQELIVSSENKLIAKELSTGFNS
ncbi:MAG TPA: hypothetical protein PLL67_02765, partial [Gammaproteobacteria bacterium]|nr:hypothetical protein [Gammaproteobacteria bacterium]